MDYRANRDSLPAGVRGSDDARSFPVLDWPLTAERNFLDFPMLWRYFGRKESEIPL